MPELVGEQGIILQENTPQCLAQALEQLMTDTALRKQLEETGPSRARQFTFQAAAGWPPVGSMRLNCTLPLVVCRRICEPWSPSPKAPTITLRFCSVTRVSGTSVVTLPLVVRASIPI